MASDMSKITDLVDTVKKLEQLLQQKDEKIAALEKRVDEFEQYTRRDDVIISGLKPRPYSYVKATREKNEDDLTATEQLPLEEQVIQFFQKHDITIIKEHIAACHTLSKQEGQKERNIILRFANRRHKVDLMRQGIKLRDANVKVYMNEHLTARNALIAKRARDLRKQKKIQATWTRDCKIWIRTNNSSDEEGNKVLLIRDLKDLDKYGTV